jgi:hypothetical protein
LRGSLPALAAPHRPSPPVPLSFVATLHAWHVKLQALSQQNPSTQKPEAHEVAAVHAVPDASLGLH